MKNRKISFRISVPPLIFLSTILAINSSAQTSNHRSKVDKSTLLYLFQNHGFPQLNSKLEEFQRLYESDYQEEENIFKAFEVFSKTDTAYGSLLTKWIKDYPDSYVPFTARAKYYCACAWEVRGRKRIINREQKEYKEMEHLFSLARLDIDEALKKNKQLDICYSMIMEIGMATADEDMKNEALASALKNHPYAYNIRMKYLQTLAPRWGGSYQKMAEYINSCEKDIVNNPKLKELSASIPAEKGSISYFLGKYHDAVNMYTESLKYSVQAAYYADRADAYCKLNNFKQAFVDYDNALELSPNDPDYLSRKADAIAMQNKASSMTQTNQGVQRYNPNDSRTNLQDESLISERSDINERAKKGGSLIRSGRFEDAIREFTEIISLASYDVSAYYNRAICYIQLNNSDAAIQDLRKVVDLKPDHMNAHYRMVTLYANRGMYNEALNSINVIISADQGNADAIFTRAKIYSSMGSNVEAMNDARQACDMGYQPACRFCGQVQMVK